MKKFAFLYPDEKGRSVCQSMDEEDVVLFLTTRCPAHLDLDKKFAIDSFKVMKRGQYGEIPNLSGAPCAFLFRFKGDKEDARLIKELSESWDEE